MLLGVSLEGRAREPAWIGDVIESRRQQTSDGAVCLLL